MLCEFCRSKLNPYLLRQVISTEDGLIFEVECPKCRERNNVSRAFYFALRRDWLMPIVKPINNKLPSELNVIFVSMERCGISWVIRNLNQVHEAMFNKPIKFKPEISHVIATRDRFDLPLHWNNVYNVDPEVLLKRGYDRVVIVHRDLETLLKVYNLYYPKNLSSEQRLQFVKKSKQDYKKVYGKRVNHKNCLWLDLQDLNKYTVKTFNELMDFLNFPETSRPITIAIKPPGLRDWEAYSSVLEKGHTLTGNLGRIANAYTLRDGLLEYSSNVRSEKDKITLKDILVIGPRIYKGCHLSENIYYAFKELGYNVQLLPIEALETNNNTLRIMYKERKILYPLSKALKYANNKPELIIIDEPSWFFYNDVDIPVFYVHREFKRPPKVFYPDVAFFWHKGVSTYFKDMFAPYWANQVRRITELPPAVDPKKFKLVKNKELKGIVHLAGREPLNALANWKELTAKALVYETKRQVEYVKSLELTFVQNRIGCLTDSEYRSAVPDCEAIWSLQPATQYISRRMLDGMISKSVVFLKLENEEHRKVLDSLGLYMNEHYININELKDLKKLNQDFKYENYLEMVEKAYNVVKNNHTFVDRAKFLVEIYKDFMLSKKGVIIE